MSRHVVAMVGDLSPGGRKLVEAAGRRIALFFVNGEYFALGDRCPHQGASLGRGRLTGLVGASAPGAYSFERAGEIVRCPWHGWEFDLRTGHSVCDPRRMRTKCFPVSVESGQVLSDGALKAETFPVSLDGEYVVVEI